MDVSEVAKPQLAAGGSKEAKHVIEHHSEDSSLTEVALNDEEKVPYNDKKQNDGVREAEITAMRPKKRKKTGSSRTLSFPSTIFLMKNGMSSPSVQSSSARHVGPS